MRRRLHGLVPLVLFVAFALPCAAQSLTGADRWADSARRLVDAATPRGDRAQLAAVRLLLERALAAFPDEPLLLYYKGYALWREAPLLIAAKHPDSAGALLEAADDALERSAAKRALAETHALRASVIGQRIGTTSNPLAGMVMGPRASAQMERAEELGPQNPRVWLLKGMNAMYTPKMWGGGLEKAEAALRRSLALFERDQTPPPMPSWGRADAYIFLGQVLAQQGRRDDARVAYQKALALEPEHGWVTYVLLPALDRKKE